MFEFHNRNKQHARDFGRLTFSADSVHMRRVRGPEDL